MRRPASLLGRYALALCGVFLGLASAAPPSSGAPNSGGPQPDLDPQLLYEVILPNYLTNFARYVRWPESAHTEGGTVQIGIFSGHPSAGLIERGLAGKTIDQSPIQVHRSPETAVLRQCRLILLDRPNREMIVRIHELLGSSPALVVSYLPEAGAGPTGIELVFKEGELRFHVSTYRMAQAGLSPSPDLLRLALPPPIMQIKIKPAKAKPDAPAVSPP